MQLVRNLKKASRSMSIRQKFYFIATQQIEAKPRLRISNRSRFNNFNRSSYDNALSPFNLFVKRLCTSQLVQISAKTFKLLWKNLYHVFDSEVTIFM